MPLEKAEPMGATLLDLVTKMQRVKRRYRSLA